jgi:hypothetical protein
MLVLAIGRPASACRRASASAAPERCTPPPATTSGRLAASSASASFCRRACTGTVRSSGKRPSGSSLSCVRGAALSQACVSTSGDTSSTTGPGRPDVAIRTARSTYSAARSATSMRRTHLAQAPNSAWWSSSWNAFLSALLRGTSCTMARIGTEALVASAKPATSNAAAGPFCAVITEIWRLTRAAPSAIAAPAFSVR